MQVRRQQEPSGAQTPGPPGKPGCNGQHERPQSHGIYVPVEQAQPAPVQRGVSQTPKSLQYPLQQSGQSDPHPQYAAQASPELMHVGP